jgi:hypothetical protein
MQCRAGGFLKSARRRICRCWVSRARAWLSRRRGTNDDAPGAGPGAFDFVTYAAETRRRGGGLARQ